MSACSLYSRHRQYRNFQPQYQYQYQKTHLGNTNTNTNTSQLVNLNTNTNTNTGKNLNTQYPIPIPQYQYLLYSSFAIEKPNRYSWTNPCWWSHLPVPFATMLLLTLPDWRCMKGCIQERSHLHVPSVIKHFNKIVIWRSMKGHTTQDRSHLPAPSG